MDQDIFTPTLFKSQIAKKTKATRVGAPPRKTPPTKKGNTGGATKRSVEQTTITHVEVKSS